VAEAVVLPVPKARPAALLSDTSIRITDTDNGINNNRFSKVGR
jgi:hypothetical protein